MSQEKSCTSSNIVTAVITAVAVAAIAIAVTSEETVIVID